MKNKNVLVLVIVAVLIAAVGAAGFFATRGPQGGQAPQQQAKAGIQCGDPLDVAEDLWPYTADDGGEQRSDSCAQPCAQQGDEHAHQACHGFVFQHMIIPVPD